MATPRTTSDLVKGIIDTETGKDLTPFIAIANQITTDICGSSSYTDDGVGSKMELIERWLAAHFYTIYDNQLSQAHAGSVSAGFQFKVGFGLKNSMYGQQAILLDTDGNLAKIDNIDQTKRKITVGGGWLGTRCYPVYFWDTWPDVTVDS